MEDLAIQKRDNLAVLDSKSDEIVNKIVEEEDVDSLKNLISIFNANQSKKDIVRNNVYSILLDRISAQMLERFEKNPNAFSNKDLIEYLSAIKTAKGAEIDIEALDTPTIQNNTQINVNIDSSGLDRDSKERVVDAVQSFLKRIKHTENTDIIDVSED